jgi:hypothetical protein
MSNMASLPDPSLFPDPYPSGYTTVNPANVTPPISLFSAGSSSARSSAYTSASPASALRSSVASSDSAHNVRHHHQQQHYQHYQQLQFQPHLASSTTGDSMLITGLYPFLDPSEAVHHFASSFPALDSPSPHQIGMASTADESVQLRDMDQPASAITARPPITGSRPGSRPPTVANEDLNPALQTRWSSSSAASQGSSWGNFDPNFDSINPLPSRNSGAVGNRGGNDPNAYEDAWNHPVVDERDEAYHTDEDETHEDDDMDRTAAVLLAEQGHGEIVNGAGKDVNELHVPMRMSPLTLLLLLNYLMAILTLLPLKIPPIFSWDNPLRQIISPDSWSMSYLWYHNHSWRSISPRTICSTYRSHWQLAAIWRN